MFKHLDLEKAEWWMLPYSFGMTFLLKEIYFDNIVLYIGMFAVLMLYGYMCHLLDENDREFGS